MPEFDVESLEMGNKWGGKRSNRLLSCLQASVAKFRKTRIDGPKEGGGAVLAQFSRVLHREGSKLQRERLKIQGVDTLGWFRQLGLVCTRRGLSLVLQKGNAPIPGMRGGR